MPIGGTLTINTYIIVKSFASTIKSGISQFLTIEIADTGHGIDPKDLPHIFEPFFTKKDKGTGLGLAVTHGIIENHHGTIKVTSEPGKGTTFRIELPL
jgi:signal transduction histidine kinase